MNIYTVLTKDELLLDACVKNISWIKITISVYTIHVAINSTTYPTIITYAGAYS